MTRPEPLRVGIIGLGRMGQNHVRVVSLLGGASLTFVHDANAEIAERTSAAAGAPAADDLDAALATADAVIICTPTVTHADYIRRAAGRVGNIFVEKPLT